MKRVVTGMFYALNCIDIDRHFYRNINMVLDKIHFWTKENGNNEILFFWKRKKDPGTFVLKTDKWIVRVPTVKRHQWCSAQWWSVFG